MSANCLVSSSENFNTLIDESSGEKLITGEWYQIPGIKSIGMLGSEGY